MHRGHSEETEECSHHVDIAVGEVDEPDYAVDHRVAESDERVYASERQAIDQLLQVFHGHHLCYPRARRYGPDLGEARSVPQHGCNKRLGRRTQVALRLDSRDPLVVAFAFFDSQDDGALDGVAVSVEGHGTGNARIFGLL